MDGAETSGNVSTGLARVKERARRDPHGRMLSLSHHIDVEALRRAFHRIRKDAAVGVDGVTVEEYGRDLERRDDAERVMEVLGKRLARYGLRLAADKTRLQDFRRPPDDQQGGKGPSTFDFLGFTHYWRRSRQGKWHQAWKTRKKSLHKAITALQTWCKENLHLSIPEQHAALTRRILGHFRYFGVNGNAKALRTILIRVERAWIRWLKRRSQRTRMTWVRFNRMLREMPLPKVRVYRNLWAAP